MNRIFYDYIRRLHGDSIEDICRLWKCTRNTYYNKLTGKSKKGITLNEVKILVERWNLSPVEIYEMFFKGGSETDERLRYE